MNFAVTDPDLVFPGLSILEFVVRQQRTERISRGATALVSAVLRWEGSKDLGGAAATKN